MPTTSSSVKTDPRVRRTQRLLRDALVALILEKDFAVISIKEITERADVAYITFFRHFDSPESLLMEVLDLGLAELLTHIEMLAKQSGKASVEIEGRLIFEYIQDNAQFFSILIKSQSASRIRRKIVRNIAAIFRRSCAPLAAQKDPLAVKLAANHIATSLLSLVEWWLENHMNPSPAEMGRVYRRMIIESTVGAVKILTPIAANS